jgi:formylglycine-generating enzyme required for sulfatase activity
VLHSNLIVGVFFLAEGAALDEARQALDAAGDSPSAALYKERWEAVKMGAAEAAAKAAWLRVQDAAKPGITPATAKRLTDLLGDFEKKHGETKIHKGAAKAIADLKTRIEDSLGYAKWPFDEAEARRRQKATADALGVKIEQDVDLGGVKMAFVLIPAGEFLMGSPPTTGPEKLAAAYGGDPKEYEGEFPQHRVKISRPFWMAKHEVTQEQYMAILQTNPSANKDKPKNPVEQVGWNQASGFAKVLSEKLHKAFRLPTEAEWEYACRAGTATEFYFGNDAAKIPDFGWQGVTSTAPAGLKKPNAWGLCDMAGNVWEWCEDWHGKYDGGAQTDPKGAPAGGSRVLRGGSWGDPPRDVRSAYRGPVGHGIRIDHFGYGFRAVLAPGPK